MAVYFIRDRACGAIKIGYTDGAPRARVSQLQVASAHDLELLGAIDGDLETERELHYRFESLRLRGEWFRATPELLAYVEERLGPRCDFCGQRVRRVYGAAARICRLCANTALLTLSEAPSYLEVLEGRCA